VNTGGELGEDGVLAFFLIFFDPEHCGGVIDGAIGTSTNISISIMDVSAVEVFGPRLDEDESLCLYVRVGVAIFIGVPERVEEAGGGEVSIKVGESSHEAIERVEGVFRAHGRA